MSSQIVYDVDRTFGDERLPRRFWSKVAAAPEGCWLWNGARSKGYGRFSLGDRNGRRLVQAHRHAYEVLVAPVPSEIEIDHLCRNRACVNPAHLEPVSHRENSLRGDGLPAVNYAKTHCKNGHPFDGDNLKLTLVGELWRRECRTCLRAHYRKADVKRGKVRAA